MDYDSHFCPECNRWLSAVCGDPSCPFCPDRPYRPLPAEKLFGTLLTGDAYLPPQKQNIFNQLLSLIYRIPLLNIMIVLIKIMFDSRSKRINTIK